MEPKVNFYLDRAFNLDRLNKSSLHNVFNPEQVNKLTSDDKKRIQEIIKTKPLQIWLSLSFLKYDRVKVYTGERIEQVYWDAAKKRVNPSKYKKGAYEFNEWLNSLEETVISEVRTKYRFNKTETPTKENIANLIKRIIQESKEVNIKKDAPTLIGAIEAYKDTYKNEWTHGFTQIVNATIEHLKTFETWRNKPLSPFEDYSEAWRGFKEYLVDKNFNNSTSNKYLKIFRRLLKYLYDAKIISNLKLVDLKPFGTADSFRIALKEKEIEVLAKHTYDKDYLNRARDLMLIQIFTGQRVGDLPQVLEQIKSGGEIHILQGKTKTRITIPTYPLLEKHLKAIAKRYPDGLEAFSDQKYNEYIKDCCNNAKINKPHTWVELMGNESVTKTEPRYNLVSSHTCRRTFATLSKKKGISDKAIMAITGHTSHKVFLEYIRTDDEDVNIEFNEKMK